MEKTTTIVLEGGALRGVYSSGVLDVLMEHGLWFPNVVGVSAGALNGLSYLSRQPYRSVSIQLHHVRDPRYMGVSSLLKKGHHFFNFDFLFGEISDCLIPFDYDAFSKAEERLYAVATNCETGEATFLHKGNCPDIFQACRASASMPLLSKVIPIGGTIYLDGGVSNPVPLPDELPFAAEKIVLVLTRPKGYRKQPVSPAIRKLYHRHFSHYPELVRILDQGPERYNRRMERIDQLEAAGKVFVIRPQTAVTVSRTEKNIAKLSELYQQGCREAKAQMADLCAFLER